MFSFEVYLSVFMDWGARTSRRLSFLRGSYNSFLKQYPPEEQPFPNLKNPKHALNLGLLSIRLYQAYRDYTATESLKYTETEDSFVVKRTMDLWLVKELCQWVTDQLYRIRTYINYARGYQEETKHLEEAKHMHGLDFWELANTPASLPVTKYRTVSVFVQDNKVVMVDPRVVRGYAKPYDKAFSDLTLKIKPNQLSDYYSQLVVDAEIPKWAFDIDPLSQHLSKNFGNLFTKDLVNLIYSFTETRILSECQGSIEGLTVVRNPKNPGSTPDTLGKKLHSAMMMGVLLSRIRNNDDSPFYVGKDIDYRVILNLFHSLRWDLDQFDDFLEELKSIKGDKSVSGALSLQKASDDFLGELFAGKTNIDRVTALLSVAKDFYRGWWSYLPLESETKPEIAKVLGHIETTYWYFETMRQYPVKSSAVAHLESAIWFSIENQEDLVTWGLGTKRSYLNWLKSDEVRIIYLRKDLNICTLKCYYSPDFRLDEHGHGLLPEGGNYHTIHTRDWIYNKSRQMRLQVCEFNPNAPREANTVAEWLTQYSGYATIRSLCGSDRDENTENWYWTFQGDICWQSSAIMRVWDKWFDQSIVEPWTGVLSLEERDRALLEADPLDRERFRNDQDQEFIYLDISLKLLNNSEQHVFFDYFRTTMDVHQCWDMIRHFQYPSYVHIFRSFYWSSFALIGKPWWVSNGNSRFDTRVEEDLKSVKAGENLKIIWDQVRRYHFPDDYKWVTRNNFKQVKDDKGHAYDTFLTHSSAGIDSSYDINATRHDSNDDFGGIFKRGKEKTDWMQLLTYLQESSNQSHSESKIYPPEARNILIKSLAYECFRHSLTAHVCFVAAQRRERGGTLECLDVESLTDRWATPSRVSLDPYVAAPHDGLHRSSTKWDFAQELEGVADFHRDSTTDLKSYKKGFCVNHFHEEEQDIHCYEQVNPTIDNDWGDF